MNVRKRLRPSAAQGLGNGGFTVLELLIALLLLVVGLLAVITVLWSSATTGSFTKQMTTAASLGEEILERAKTTSYNGLTAAGVFVDYTASNGTATGFTRRWKVTESAGVKTITAEVSWKGGVTGTRTRTFSMTRRPDY